MARARVSIACVLKFSKAVDNQKEDASRTMRARECLGKIVCEIKVAIMNLEECSRNCDIALNTAQTKIEALARKLAELESKLANTPEYITERIEVGKDAEGNPIYEERKYRNPERAILEKAIEEVRKKIALLEELSGELEKEQAKIKQAIDFFTNAIGEINRAQDEIHTAARSITKKAEGASAQLKQAITCIQQYISQSIHLNAIPSYTSINWINYTSFDTTIETREEIVVSRTSDDECERTDQVFYGVGGMHKTDASNRLLSNQGKAREGYGGTCGHVSTANVLRQLGVKEGATEEEVLNRAEKLGILRPPTKGENGGGTTNNDIIKLMSSYGLKATKRYEVEFDDIEKSIKKGGAMMLSVRAKQLEDPEKVSTILAFKRNADHWVTVTGVKKDESTGEVLGVFIKDTGNWSKKEKGDVFISKRAFNKMRAVTEGFTAIAVFK